ncbi:MAG: hypothetical protein H0X07_00160 [Gemmatimonadales bacterium]|nr:hypothetical protein [Gemmatimonadales bacterium]
MSYHPNSATGGNPAMAGDVTGTAQVSVVEKIRGKNVPTPGLTEDEKILKYDHDTGAYVWIVQPGGGSTPTGTGFRHVTTGVEDAAAALVVNADVAAGAAIVESKLSLNNATHANTNDPVAGEKAALVGTSGTPGAANKYVTDSDARNTNSRTPTSHGSGLHDATVEATANKAAASGYAGLDATTKVPTAQLGSGAASASTFLRGDQSWAAPAGGSASITQVEVDWGEAPARCKTFTVTDATVSVSSQIIINQSGEAPTGRQADENEMEAIICRAVPGAGQFTVYADAMDRQLVRGLYKLNYLVG